MIELDPSALLDAAVARHPGHATLTCGLAEALQREERLEEAGASYRQALMLDPNLFDAWYGLGAMFLKERAYGGASEVLRRALTLRPGAAPIRTMLGHALFQLGEIDAALLEYRAAAAAASVGQLALANIACIVPGSPAADNAAILAERRRWLATVPRPQPEPRLPRPAGAKLRIGYVSSFFGSANWMKPVYGVVNEHDRNRFEVHLIALGPAPSPEAGYQDHAEDFIWRAQRVDNAQLARLIAAAGIDVLIDLNGYSDQKRLALYLHRPAPVQIGWFNMYATTGMTVFDCLVGDAAVIPAAEEPFYSEPIERVPGAYAAFRVAHPVPEVKAPPCLANGLITLGCLGSAYKITAEVVAAWASILHAAPTARLLLRNATLDEPSNQAALLARFAAAGISADRLTLEGRAPHFEFLTAYDRIDVALDTFPYSGGTTTMEALWQGVPVLTFNGDRWASRTSRSLLLAGGLPEWVADDCAGYVAQAIVLANDPQSPERLAALRYCMRERLRASRACDSTGLCRALEEIYLRRRQSCGDPSKPRA